MEPGSTEKSRDVAANVFNSINLLAIKRSVRLLLELEDDVIEDFVKKYSGIMIFFLNILDQQRSHELLEKLTDASIIYIIEEEMRFLLIREIALVSDDAGMLLNLTALIERVDDPVSYNTLHENMPDVLGYLLRVKADRAHFAYMDTLRTERRARILNILIERNSHAAFCMLPYASERVLCELVDRVAETQAEEISLIPAEIVGIRFRHEHQNLLATGVFEHLPLEIRVRVEELDRIKKRYIQEFGEIDRLHMTDAPLARSRETIMNLTYNILKRINPDYHEMVLSEFQQKGVLSEREIYILSGMMKQM